MQRKRLLTVLFLSATWFLVFAGSKESLHPADTQKTAAHMTLETRNIESFSHKDAVSENTQEPVIIKETPDSFCGDLVLGEFDADLTELSVPEEQPTEEPAEVPMPEENTPVPEETIPDFWCPDFILYEDYVSERLVTNVISYYCRIPENVRTWFQTYGYQIHIMNDINVKYGYDYPIQALTAPYESMIYISNRSGSEPAVIHEVGHAAAYANMNIVHCDDFQAIYDEEVSVFAGTFRTHANNYSTIWEYFAEAYEKCILHESSMQSNCPKTYGYIINYMNAL